MHESVGHPIELDRVYGSEAAYAGTSFLKPTDLGSLRYGSEKMNITADSTTPGGLGTFAFDDEGVPGSPRADRRRGRAAQLPHLARDGRAPRRRRGRLDARRRLEPDAAGPHDEPPPRARRGHVRGPARRRRRRASTSRRTRAGRSTTSGSTSSSARRSRGRSRTASSGGCCATRPTPGSRREFWGSLDAVAGPGGVAHAGADELRQGPAGAGRARLARRVAVPLPRRPGGRQGVSERRPRGRRARARGGGGRRRRRDRPSASARGSRGSRRREVHQPTLIENCSRDAADRPRREDRHGVDEPARRGVACARSRERAGEAADASVAEEGFPGLAPPQTLPDVEGWDDAVAGDRPGGPGAACPRCDRRVGDRAVRVLHERRDRARDRVDRRCRRVPGHDRRRRRSCSRRAKARRATRAGRPGQRTASTPPRSGARRQTRRSAHATRRRSSRRRTARCSSRTRSPTCSRTSPSTRSVRNGLLEGRSYLAGRLGEQDRRREGLDRGRRARPARPAEELRLRGRAEAARAADRERRREGRRLGSRERRARRRRERVDGPRAAARLPPVRPARVRHLGRRRRRRLDRRALRARRRRHLRHAPPLPRDRRPAARASSPG